jgi:hypothetical protein
MASTKLSLQGQGMLAVGSAAITIAAIADEASADYTISDANASVGDVISVSLANADMEAGLLVVGAWVSAANTISVRIANDSGGALTGGAATVYYSIQSNRSV